MPVGHRCVFGSGRELLPIIDSVLAAVAWVRINNWPQLHNLSSLADSLQTWMNTLGAP